MPCEEEEEAEGGLLKLASEGMARGVVKARAAMVSAAEGELEETVRRRGIDGIIKTLKQCGGAIFSVCSVCTEGNVQR